MLKAEYSVVPTEMDVGVVEKRIPADPYLRRLKAALDFEPLRALVADCYVAGLGAPAEDPVRRLKLRLLQFPYDLSDSQGLRQAQVNVAFRFLLDFSRESPLPVPSLLSQFRTRLGGERFTRGFNEILRQGRAQGLVKDRLRLKEAPQLIANIAIPSTRRLVAQRREQVRAAAQCFTAEEVAAPRAQIDALRTATADLPEAPRLLARVAHLRDLVAWGEQWQQRLREAAAGARPVAPDAQAAAFSAALDVGHKGRNEREPDAQDQRLSLADPEARTGKHGDSYEGYLLAVSRDADSELICALAGLPANGEEGANATPLIKSEEPARGNDSASLSLDRSGYRGAVRAELSEAANGPHLTGDVPPIDWTPPAPELCQPAAFTLKAGRDEGRCPGGATTRTRQRTTRGHGWRFAFPRSPWRACPLRAQCVKPATRRGRTGSKNDYEAQYHAARQRAQSAASHEVRRAQPRRERKLAELGRWHAGRCVRYRGRLGGKIQYVLTAIVVNGKRIVKLLGLPLQPQLA